MGLSAIFRVLQGIWLYLDIMLDALSYRIFGLGDLEEESVTGKVAIVTGSNAGIGKQVARDLADRGAKVILGTTDVKLDICMKRII